MAAPHFASIKQMVGEAISFGAFVRQSHQSQVKLFDDSINTLVGRNLPSLTSGNLTCLSMNEGQGRRWLAQSQSFDYLDEVGWKAASRPTIASFLRRQGVVKAVTGIPAILWFQFQYPKTGVTLPISLPRAGAISLPVTPQNLSNPALYIPLKFTI